MSSSRPDLHLDWCSYEAAKYAVEHWHYSRRMPAGKLTSLGVWEGGDYIGCVLFGYGANNHLGAPFCLAQTEACELVRVALTTHTAPVSQIVAVARRLLRKQAPGLRLIVSYADPKEGHAGGIYQASGWIYLGRSKPQRELLVGGRFLHKRIASARWGTAAPSRIQALTGLPVEYAPLEWKHTYLYPLDTEIHERILPLAQPYPKRVGSIENDAPAVPGGTEGGVIPTPTLQTA